MNMDRAARFEREKRQGLRDEGGAFIGDGNGLNALDFAQGYDDAKNGRPLPDDPSVSYEVGRTRWEEDDAYRRKILEEIDRRFAENEARFRQELAGRPDILARYDAAKQEASRATNPRTTE